jgi:hypothetical protein
VFTYTETEWKDLQIMKKMICTGCGKEPHELTEYQVMAREEINETSVSSLDAFDDMAQDEINRLIDEWAWFNEGTMNWENGHYNCTECYMKAGMPSSPTGWKAP